MFAFTHFCLFVVISVDVELQNIVTVCIGIAENEWICKDIKRKETATNAFLPTINFFSADVFNPKRNCVLMSAIIINTLFLSVGSQESKCAQLATILSKIMRFLLFLISNYIHESYE